jgi:hypothetical protein
MRSTLHNEFPLPWTAQERSTCFVVHDKTRQASHSRTSILRINPVGYRR